jgi:hypothetical protein
MGSGSVHIVVAFQRQLGRMCCILDGLGMAGRPGAANKGWLPKSCVQAAARCTQLRCAAKMLQALQPPAAAATALAGPPTAARTAVTHPLQLQGAWSSRSSAQR